ncbi:MAG: hypothetical protein KatS3mg109_1849 [Pirellulaceae bacterium]|nr:MAG: hypothetical protein KatS3mg109_1849 [Pirellulaceae bacterium]
MASWVEVTFDCLPLRAIPRIDIPLDATPQYRALCERLKRAIEQHGTFNTYYLYNARAVYHLTNHPVRGMLEFTFEGTVFTDEQDTRTVRADLDVQLVRETVEWLVQPVVDWFRETVTHTVLVEFDRYIAAGDLEKARQRMERIQQEMERHGGYLGMYL